MRTAWSPGHRKILNVRARCALGLAILLGQGASSAGFAQAHLNLVPLKPAAAPNYYCTWAAQNYVTGQGAATIDIAQLEGGAGSSRAKQAFTEAQMFGPRGWAKTYYPKVRQDLLFLMDDGYYTGAQSSMELDVQKFPSFAGVPSQRLVLLRKAITKEGWRGLGLWTRGTPGAAELITPLLQWSKDAGVAYWKIDGGDGDYSVAHLRDTRYPALILEHVNGEGPFNGDWSADGRFGAQPWDSVRQRILRSTEVYRTYDVSAALSIPTTLDRVAEILNGAQGHPEVTALLNCEDEVYVAAALGCTMGVMRFPLSGLRPSGDPDLFFNGTRQVKRRMDEVVRALRWQRIAAPFGAGRGYVRLDSRILTDEWQFGRGETWESDKIGKVVKQGAPARVSRGLPLPAVTAEGEPPYVIAGRFPNGAVAVCTLGRTHTSREWFVPPADVTVDAGDAPGPFGVFGHYRTLTIRLPRPLGRARIVAQDLAGDRAEDVTRQVHVTANTLSLSGALIDRIGMQSSTPGDLSDPGLVLAILPR